MFEKEIKSKRKRSKPKSLPLLKDYLRFKQIAISKHVGSERGLILFGVNGDGTLWAYASDDKVWYPWSMDAMPLS